MNLAYFFRFFMKRFPGIQGSQGIKGDKGHLGARGEEGIFSKLQMQ